MKKVFMMFIIMLSLFTVVACPSPDGSDPDPTQPTIQPPQPTEDDEFPRIVDGAIHTYLYCDMTPEDCHIVETEIHTHTRSIRSYGGEIYSHSVDKLGDGVLYIGYGNGSNWCTLGLDVKEPEMALTDFHIPAIIYHEFWHHIGMWHEHQRSDRDKFLIINYPYIQTDKVHNFDKVTDYNLKWDITKYPYFDYESIMMYHSWSFTTVSYIKTIYIKSDPSIDIFTNKTVTVYDTYKVADVVNEMIDRLSTDTTSRRAITNKWIPEDKVIIME